MMIVRSPESIVIFAIAAGVSVLFLLNNWMVGGCSQCQLCQAPVTRSLKCNHISSAKKALGSFRLRVAGSILLTGTFRCPYCGEDFNLITPDLPESPKQSSSRRSVSLRQSGTMPTRKH